MNTLLLQFKAFKLLNYAIQIEMVFLMHVIIKFSCYRKNFPIVCRHIFVNYRKFQETFGPTICQDFRVCPEYQLKVGAVQNIFHKIETKSFLTIL